MVKKVRSKSGMLKHAALVVCGWLSFITSQVASDPLLKCVLLSIARVPPYRDLYITPIFWWPGPEAPYDLSRRVFGQGLVCPTPEAYI